MKPPERSYPLLAGFALGVIGPMIVVVVAVTASGLYLYQQAVTLLVIDRDRQLAALASAQLWQIMQSYERELDHLVIRNSADQFSLTESADISQVYSAGIMLAGPDGAITAASSPQDTRPLGEDASGQPVFEAARRSGRAAFSDVIHLPDSSPGLIVVAVPLYRKSGEFAGEVLGAVRLDKTSLGAPIASLRIGDGGIAYLVDGQGQVIAHPVARVIGTDLTDRPFVQELMAGRSGGTLWFSPTLKQQVVVGYATIPNTRWGLIVREPWAAVAGPAWNYGIFIGLLIMGTLVLTGLLVLRGVRRVAVPLRHLVAQTGHLAAGRDVEASSASRIREIDTLELAFGEMAAQLNDYRAGLRRYIDSVTQSQEEERRRIARELHDETVQSLLTITRKLELFQASETDPARQTRLAELQAMVVETTREVRQISRDLRPLILEDLGLIPALKTLIREPHTGPAPAVQMEVTGQPVNLSSAQELAIYRIAQEALTNAVKHARASQVMVRLGFVQGRVSLSISDDGAGFEVPASLTHFAQHNSFGLLGIQERARALGGTFEIQSRPGRGTCLNVILPNDLPERPIDNP